MITSRFSLVCIAAASLSACAAFPGREPAPQIKPAGSYAAQQSFAAPAGAWPSDAWWDAYGDAQLSGLIREALAGAPSLGVAEARLRRAEALAQVTDAARRPQLSANASGTTQRQSRNYLSPADATPDGWKGYGRATLDFSWELDFWGRNRAAFAAATSDAEAARADVAQARLLLATAIASAYAELARLHALHDTASAALEVRAKTAGLMQRRHEHQLETLGSVRQAESRRAGAETDVLALAEQLALQRNSIAALLGAGPDRGLAIARPAANLAKGYALPPQLALDLIGRRPDIAAARLRAAAAAGRVDEAKAAFYPNVNLAAFIGVQSLGLGMLTKGGSMIGSAGPAVSLPIFDGGRLRGQLRGADADYAAAVAGYEDTVVQALQDVADAAVSLQALTGQLDRSGAAVDAARDAWRIQNARYEGGLATYLDVLTAEDGWLSTRRTQADLQARSLALDVALVRALGGGYVASL
jgi:NodT family efflux transporter outer membrane factor (OMF) lipoprotein